MSRLTDYRLLSFDVYGTLIDWETGILTALQPILDRSQQQQQDAAPISRERILREYYELEHMQQRENPKMLYSELLAAVHPLLCQRLGLAVAPTPEENRQFGESVGRWPAFPDTVDALRRLGRHFKLVVLSNVDRESFQHTNAGSLRAVPFDLVLTAQDIGSYKPDPHNFEYMLAAARTAFGIDRAGVLQTAQSQFHDHHPARKAGIQSVWIVRPGSQMGNVVEPVYTWKFDTLGDFADAVDRELGLLA